MLLSGHTHTHTHTHTYIYIYIYRERERVSEERERDLWRESVKKSNFLQRKTFKGFLIGTTTLSQMLLRGTQKNDKQ